MRASLAQCAATLALLAAFVSAAPSPARRARDVRPLRTTAARAVRALLQRSDPDGATVDPDRSRGADESGSSLRASAASASGMDPAPAPPAALHPFQIIGRDSAVTHGRPTAVSARITPAHSPGWSPRGPPLHA